MYNNFSTLHLGQCGTSVKQVSVNQDSTVLGYKKVMVDSCIVNTKLFNNFLHKITLLSKSYGST
jgi:hypothetical protein